VAWPSADRPTPPPRRPPRRRRRPCTGQDDHADRRVAHPRRARASRSWSAMSNVAALLPLRPVQPDRRDVPRHLVQHLVGSHWSLQSVLDIVRRRSPLRGSLRLALSLVRRLTYDRRAGCTDALRRHSATEAAFRAEVRDWLDAHAEPRTGDDDGERACRHLLRAGSPTDEAARRACPRRGSGRSTPAVGRRRPGLVEHGGRRVQPHSRC
jgi:hypothetical protein